MNIKKILIATCLCLAFDCHLAFAQIDKPVIGIKDINAYLVLAPQYTVATTGQPVLQKGIDFIKNHSSSQKWLIVEAELLSEPEWADEVNVTFYVLAKYSPTVKEKPPAGADILSATVTIVNMQSNIKDFKTAKQNPILNRIFLKHHKNLSCHRDTHEQIQIFF